MKKLQRDKRALCRLFLLLFLLSSFQIIPARSFLSSGAFIEYSTFNSRQLWKHASSKSSEEEHSSHDDVKEIVRQPRIREKRRPYAQKRPDHYWRDPYKLRSELRAFWIDRGVKLPKNKPPPIPNISILNYCRRSDLNYPINLYGGRENVSRLLGGSQIIPGRWNKAISESSELRKLVEADATLSLTSPPPRPPKLKTKESSLWPKIEGRKPVGYWNITNLAKEIYPYVAAYREKYRRPAVWMPRPEEFAAVRRFDIRYALKGLGGSEQASRLAGMVPYREWRYFEDQLELLSEARRFQKEHGNGDFRSYPIMKDAQRHGFDRLVLLNRHYGGARYLTARFGMKPPKSSDLNFSPFCLDFAVRLLSFIREHELRKNPPLSNPSIRIASPSQLDCKDEESKYLHESIMKFGGYENVARRLGLAFYSVDEKDDTNESPELRMLFQATATLSTENLPSLNSLPWNQEAKRIVPHGHWNDATLVKEIHAYVTLYREKYRQPAVWMPRPSEFAKEGRSDVTFAIIRLGGSERITGLAGMVPFREWFYFEDQLELLLEVRRFLKEHENAFGGQNLLAARFGMISPSVTNKIYSDLNYGPFSLDFAIRLLVFIRELELRKSPPLANPSIRIPSPKQLDCDDEESKFLHESIMKFGGYENVARRLGLDFYSEDEK